MVAASKKVDLGDKLIFYAKRCQFGVTGEILADRDTNETYVNCDRDVANCQTSVYIGGGNLVDNFKDLFGNNLASLAQCYHCHNDEIPFIHIKFNGDINPYGFNDNTSIPVMEAPDASPDEGVMTVCRNPDNIEVAPNTERNFVENCGFGVIMVDFYRIMNLGNGTIVCAACKDGFKPVYNPQGFITSCTLIENCSELDYTNPDDFEIGLFNGCGRCIDGTVYPDRFVFDECIQGDSGELMKINGVDYSIICKPKFLNLEYFAGKNYQHSCDNAVIDFCEDYNWRVNYKSFVSNDPKLIMANHQLIHHYNSFNNGCTKCQGDYVASYALEDYCFESQKLSAYHLNYLDPNFVPVDTFFIDHCYLYFSDSNLCDSCFEGYSHMETQRGICVEVTIEHC